jgi:uncharacterized phage-associated protein
MVGNPEGILENIIVYLCLKSSLLSETKLTKLVYLADVYHCQMFGERLTDIPFRHHFYGAWAPDISKTLGELYEKGIIEEKMVLTKKGYKATVPKPTISKAMIHLPKTAFEVLDQIVDDWGDATTEEVVNFTKKTLPFLNTSFDREIDFSRCSPIKEYAKEKGITESEAATLDILSNKELCEAILEGDRDAIDGRFLTHNQVFGE